MTKPIASAALAAALLSAPAGFAQSIDSPLVSPDELAALLKTDDVAVLDIRAADGSGSYAEGHVEGAVNAPYALFRGPEDNPGQLPSEEQLTQTLRELGLTEDRPLVITYQGSDVTDFGAAARVYWTMKSAGITDLAILNGGVNAWTDAGLPLDAAAVTPQPSDITVTWDDTWTASVDDVQAAIDGETDTQLVDARPESFWKGEQAHPAAARPGTLPQSRYFVHSSWFSDKPVIVDAEAARRLAEENGLTGSENLISFCNTGHWAATNWFAMSELAGIENVKLYPESMVGWSNAGREMANAPGRIQHLWTQIKNVF
ncbi:rhodanese-like domain-containing protein [Paracoccus sp. 1_MG-2023]|uniref:sulfurtransferase n=1 Tax=unclassified Paracoccus (in: a-proteobacteria) TaxID=2688777 RepID=UPI002091E0D1|nr:MULTISPECIES: rhodanese-like domain-containing protein [unclassified Paracoccus (in: a-proteobacteria)]MDO6668522.1 rhodanese-like domain-containing protein [Paracoccus sp. 1_MG-2023]